MAGHSKWANIQQDIATASKIGGPDPDMNPRLRLAIANAKGQSMPKDNIQRAVDKGAGGEGDDYEDIRYEGFGPAGIGFIVEASTDNKNRTAMSVRTAFSKNGGNMGETGSVSFMFDQLGKIEYPLDVADEDTMMEAAIVSMSRFTQFGRPAMTSEQSQQPLSSNLAMRNPSTLFGKVKTTSTIQMPLRKS